LNGNATSATTATTATNQSGGTINATTGTVTPNTTGVSTGFNVVNGDITTYRTGGTTGVIYFGTSGSKYLYYDGANYSMPGGQLDVNGSRVLNAGNYTSYSPSLTGSGASGTWGINVTGSAGSATTATTATNQSGGTIAASTGYSAGGFGVSGSYSAQNTQGIRFGSDATYAYVQSWGGRVLWLNPQGNNIIAGSGGSQVLTASNYTSYAPSLTGSGASGTWSINVTGSAGSASTATTATTATTANALNTANNYQVNSLGVGTAGSGTAGEIRATNNVTAYYSSDIKFKENVRAIPEATEKVKAIGGKLFDWKDDYIEEHGGEDGYFVQKADFGVVAQDVQKVFPIAVRTRPDGSLAVDYEKLSALAFASLCELTARIEALEAKK
jgi:hypothetical protein